MVVTAYTLAALAAGALVAGFLLGRLLTPGRKAARRLGAERDALRQENERTALQAQEARESLKRKEQELERYRGDVVSHFSGTSELLRDLTVRYRAVYDHLAEGARSLCPEGALSLEGDPAASLGPQSGASAAGGSSADDAETDEVRRQE